MSDGTHGSQVQDLKDFMHQEFGTLRQDMGALRRETAELKAFMRQEFGAMRQDMAAIRREMECAKSTMARWVVGLFIGGVTVVAAVMVLNIQSAQRPYGVQHCATAAVAPGCAPMPCAPCAPACALRIC